MCVRYMCLLVPEYLYFAFNLVRSSTTVVSFNLLEQVFVLQVFDSEEMD